MPPPHGAGLFYCLISSGSLVASSCQKTIFRILYSLPASRLTPMRSPLEKFARRKVLLELMLRITFFSLPLCAGALVKRPRHPFHFILYGRSYCSEGREEEKDRSRNRKDRGIGSSGKGCAYQKEFDDGQAARSSF